MPNPVGQSQTSEQPSDVWAEECWIPQCTGRVAGAAEVVDNGWIRVCQRHQDMAWEGGLRVRHPGPSGGLLGLPEPSEAVERLADWIEANVEGAQVYRDVGMVVT